LTVRPGGLSGFDDKFGGFGGFPGRKPWADTEKSAQAFDLKEKFRAGTGFAPVPE
jgi:hypothetical protein